MLDTVFRLPYQVTPGAKHAAIGLDSLVGGPAANAAAAIVALGGSAVLISKVGTDAAGAVVISTLERGGIDTGGVRRVDGPTSQSAVVVDDAGERTIANHTPSAITDTTDLPVVSDIEGSDSVLVDARWSSGAERVVAIARDLGVPCLADIDLVDNVDVAPIITGATHVVFSRAALATLTGISDDEGGLRKIARTTSAFVGVTMGDEGFSWIEQDEWRNVPAIDVPVVDTNGAGDVFHGAFALGLAEGLEPWDIITMANAAAAHVCMGGSGSQRFASRQDVDRLLEGST
ncbi:MAG: PfkB family carbohydrate kinase [Actinomycetia bacterium]|nr:PfkB family carbohydrate kinase [Actinomycetes bacterium]